MVTDDEEAEQESARSVKQQVASRKHKSPADLRDVESWQEGKTDLMIILQQVGVDLKIRQVMIQPTDKISQGDGAHCVPGAAGAHAQLEGRGRNGDGHGRPHPYEGGQGHRGIVHAPELQSVYRYVSDAG